MVWLKIKRHLMRLWSVSEATNYNTGDLNEKGILDLWNQGLSNSGIETLAGVLEQDITLNKLNLCSNFQGRYGK